MADVTETPAETGQVQETATETKTTAAQDLAGDSAAPWYGEIKDPELAEWAKNKNFSDPETALKSYRGLEGHLGKNRLAIPDPEKLTEWDGWDALGAPKEADGYKDKVKMPELPEGMALDQDLLNAAFAKGAEMRIPPQQMQALVEVVADRQKAMFAAAMEEQQRSIAERDAVYEKWGQQKAANLETAQQAARLMGFNEQELVQLGDILGSGRMIEKFYDIGKRMREGGMINGGSNDLSPERAKAELQKMKTDPTIQAILRDPSHASHAEEKNRFTRLSAASVGL